MPSVANYALPSLGILRANEAKFQAKRQPASNGCIEFDATQTSFGYRWFNFGQEGLKYRTYAHRAAYMLYHNVSLTGEQVVRHQCDNPACVNPEHLLIGTHADNRKDCVGRKRNARGEGNGRAKLTADIARAIRESSEAHTVLAKRYGVHLKLIQRIRAGEIWKEAA